MSVPSLTLTLTEYEAPALDDAADEAMLDFIARRKEVIPDEFG